MLIITPLVVLFILIVSVTIIFIKWHKMEKDFKELQMNEKQEQTKEAET
jgi:hypothetical protein